jgi:hypothetical protein
MEGDAAMAVRSLVLRAVRLTHAAPSAEVRKVPALPTAMNWLPVQVTAERFWVESAEEPREVQVVESVDE